MRGESVAVGVFGNGMRYAIVHDARQASVDISLGIGVGSRHDTYEGIAHLVEHMLFKSSWLHTTRDLLRDVYMHGGKINAETSEEFTRVFCRMPRRWVHKGLRTVEELVRESKMDEIEINREKLVVANEIGETLADPHKYLINDLLPRSLYRTKGLAKPIAGTLEKVKRITPAQVRAFYRSHYVPNKMALAIVGNWPHPPGTKPVQHLLHHLLLNTFAKWSVPPPAHSKWPKSADFPKKFGGPILPHPPGPSTQTPPSSGFELVSIAKWSGAPPHSKWSESAEFPKKLAGPTLRGPRTHSGSKGAFELVSDAAAGGAAIERRETSETFASVAWRGPSAAPADEVQSRLQSVVMAALTGTMISRLFQKLREDSGLVYFVSGDTSEFHDGGSASITFGTRSSEQMKEALALLERDRADVEQNGLTHDETSTVRSFLYEKLTLAAANVSASSQFYVKRLLYGLPFRHLKDEARLVSRLTDTQIRQFSKNLARIWRQTKRTVALLGG